MHRLVDNIRPTSVTDYTQAPPVGLEGLRPEWQAQTQACVPEPTKLLAEQPDLPTRPFFVKQIESRDSATEQETTQTPQRVKTIGRGAINLVEARKAKKAERSKERVFDEAANTSGPDIILYQSWPGIITSVTDGLNPAIDAQILAERTARLGATPVDLLVSRTMSESPAEYDPNSGRIVVDARSLLQLPNIAKREIKFALIESLSGGIFEPTKDNQGNREIQRRSVGFNKYDKNGEISSDFEALNNAVAMHLLASLETGNFDEFNPDVWPETLVDSYLDADMTDQLYFEHQKILAHVCDVSGGLITPRLFIDAYFQDANSGGQSPARTTLIRQFRLAFGEMFTVQDLEQMLEDAEELTAEKVEAHKAQLTLNRKKLLSLESIPPQLTNREMLLTDDELSQKVLSKLSQDGNTQEFPVIEAPETTRSTKVFGKITWSLNRYIEAVNKASDALRRIFID